MNSLTVPHITKARSVTRHLQTIAYDVTAACLTSNYLQVPGSFDVLEQPTGLAFVGRPGTLSRVARIEAGQSVRVDYRFRDDRLLFFSRILRQSEPGVWKLSRPRMVQRRTRRVQERRPVRGDVGLRMAMMTNQGIQPFTLIDLSSGGAAVQFDPRLVGLWVGRRMTVWLETPEHQGVVVTVEVRHVSRRGCAPGHKIAGVRFVDPGTQVRQVVDRVLIDD